MKLIIKSLLISSFLLILSHTIKPCTAFILEQNGQRILAKNLDWPIGNGFLIVNRKGVTKSAFRIEESSPFNWKSKYGSISFNQFGKDFPLGGMNEKGLVIEELSYNVSQFPSAAHINLNEFQWIQYHLDQSQSVKDVLKSLEKISITPLLFKLHYFISDRSGAVAIIEFIKGKIRSYTGEKIIIPVLTNNSYKNSLKYLRLHKGFGGNKVAKKGPESPERFVRVCNHLLNSKKDNKNSIFDTAFSILDSVKQHDTQWKIVYNITHGVIHFKTGNLRETQSITLSDFNFETKEKVLLLPLQTNSKNKVPILIYNREIEHQLQKTILEKLVQLGELSKEKSQLLLKRLLDYSGDIVD